MIPNVIPSPLNNFNRILMPLEESIQGLGRFGDDRQTWEKKLQLLLNQDNQPTGRELLLLRSYGYSISYDPHTLEKFKTFTFPNDPELAQAIQSATPSGGLLIDGYKMYRPGPATAKHCNGTAKSSLFLNKKLLKKTDCKSCL